jgi:aminoglycoside phosphotransferase (APT) family kinase protein
VKPIGPKLAEGRDSEIFDHGPGKVLRLTRDGRSLVHEAEIMRHVRSHGYPCPDVHDAGDGYLVMDRIDGPTMLDAATKPPFPIRRMARTLADLHDRLHAIPPPAWIPEAALPGDALLHLDLHPLNVLDSSGGPVVIDWSNVRRGDPTLDVADVWVIILCLEVPGSTVERAVAQLGKRLFLRWFLGALDREAAMRAIPAAVEGRARDRNVSEAEIVRMRRFAEWARSKVPS